jgi:hypothetical protein
MSFDGWKGGAGGEVRTRMERCYIQMLTTGSMTWLPDAHSQDEVGDLSAQRGNQTALSTPIGVQHLKNTLV